MLIARNVYIADHMHAFEDVGVPVLDQGITRVSPVEIADGAWTPLLNEHLGCRIPIQPGKGYSLTMPRPARCPKAAWR